MEAHVAGIAETFRSDLPKKTLATVFGFICVCSVFNRKRVLIYIYNAS